jgi:RNA ligase
MEKLNWDKVNALVDQHYLMVKKHPEAKLYICNYTAKAQYDGFWNDYTLQCRGLIIDREGYIVARPFPKFFNLGEIKLDKLPKEAFDVYEKLDGSLGILYWLDGIPVIATRGAFDSEQAQVANNILHEKYPHTFDQLDKNLTYLFEIIYPGNRVVIDYGTTKELFLLAVIEIRTGREMPLPNLGIPHAPKYEGIRDLSQIQQQAREDKEGYVIRFRSGLRVKVKFPEYVRLHRIITGLSLLEIWEYLSEGKPMDALLEKVPDEVYEWVKQSVTDLQTRYAEIEAECKSVYRELPSRKETAHYFKQQKYPQVLFAMLTNKDYAPIIWKMLRPRGKETYFRQADADDKEETD